MEQAEHHAFMREQPLRLLPRVAELAPADLDAATLACWSAVHGLATLALDGGLPSGGSPHERAALTLVVAGLAPGTL